MKKSLALACLFALAACSGTGVGPEGAENECKSRVTVQLRTPSTAEFSSVSTREVDERAWRTTGVVSGQNGFGATVDMTFECVMRGSENGTYSGVADVTQ